MKSELTKKEACEQIADLIIDTSTSNCLPRTIGFDTDGDVNYDYNCYTGSECSIVISIYNTEEWTLGDFGIDIHNADEWTDELRDGLAAQWETCWLYDALQESDCDIEFAKESNDGN